jgi:hypothetical protein
MIVQSLEHGVQVLSMFVFILGIDQNIINEKGRIDFSSELYGISTLTKIVVFPGSSFLITFSIFLHFKHIVYKRQKLT